MIQAKLEEFRTEIKRQDGVLDLLRLIGSKLEVQIDRLQKESNDFDIWKWDANDPAMLAAINDYNPKAIQDKTRTLKKVIELYDKKIVDRAMVQQCLDAFQQLDQHLTEQRPLLSQQFNNAMKLKDIMAFNKAVGFFKKPADRRAGLRVLDQWLLLFPLGAPQDIDEQTSPYSAIYSVIQIMAEQGKAINDQRVMDLATALNRDLHDLDSVPESETNNRAFFKTRFMARLHSEDDYLSQTHHPALHFIQSLIDVLAKCVKSVFVKGVFSTGNEFSFFQKTPHEKCLNAIERLDLKSMG